MIFLDTCVWFELLSVRTPTKPHEIQQAMAASELFDKILRSEEKIVTCKEQLIELVAAIEKATMRTVSRERKCRNLPGIGNLKEFRKLSEFQDTKRLCETVIEDVKHFAKIHNIGEYDIDHIMKQLDLADINDCLYYDYCMKTSINFYTFDSDLKALGDNEFLHCYQVDEDKWS